MTNKQALAQRLRKWMSKHDDGERRALRDAIKHAFSVDQDQEVRRDASATGRAARTTRTKRAP